MEVFDVRLLGFRTGAAADPVALLSQTFGIDEAKARAVVANAPVLVKRGVDEHTAERFFHLLREIGAEVRIERRLEPSLRPPPPGAEPSSPSPPVPSLRAPAPTTRPSSPATTPAHVLPGLDDDPFDDGSPLPVPDFDAVGLDSARYASARPPNMAASLGSVHPAASNEPGTPRPVAPNVRPSIRPDSLPPSKGEGEGEAHGTLLMRLLGAFAYPFQRSAPAIFAGVALISSLVGLVPILGIFLSYGVQAIFFFQVIRDSGDGDDTLPKGGEFTEIGDLLAPTFRFILAMVVPFVPIGLAMSALGSSNPLTTPVVIGLLLFGLAYMPASVMLAALTNGCLGPLNPVAGIMIMTRVPASYVLTSIAVGMVFVLHGAASAAAFVVADAIPFPFVPILIANTVLLILPTVASRMLGIFLHHHRHELGIGLG